MKFVDPGYCFPLDRPRPASFLVAYAYSPSAKRRAKFAEQFPFPQCDRVETILEDSSIDAVAVLITQAIHSVWRDFVEAIGTGGEPRVNGEEALRVHRLIDALLASAQSGAPVRCDTPA